MDAERKLPQWISEHIPSELANSTLFRFNVIVDRDKATRDNKFVAVDLLPDLDLDYHLLEQQMEQLPGQYAYWAVLYSQVRYMVAVQDRVAKAVRGVAMEEIKNREQREGVKLSVDQVKQFTEANKRVQEAELELAKRQLAAGKLFHMVEAMRLKADLARSLAGFKRQEFSNS